MTAFGELEGAWQAVEERFMASPPLQRLQDGDLTLSHYAAYLRETYFYTREDPQIQALCTASIFQKIGVVLPGSRNGDLPKSLSSRSGYHLAVGGHCAANGTGASMKFANLFAAVTVALLCLVQSGLAQTKSGVDRLYILDCGQAFLPDQSRLSPGVNVGKPLDVSDNCYLIHHAQGWFLWDTGISDAVAAMPDGLRGEGTNPSWYRSKTLISQLDQLGVKPADIKYMAVSHTHPDHVGNVELFPLTMLLVQKAEYDWPLGPGVSRFKPEHPVTKLEGDHDVFGDGSVVLISTPGHTPGHQSLLVKLPKTGTVLLSGDAVHTKDNWDNRRVPGINTDKDQTIASMQRIADFLAKEQAKLWINHDKPSSDALRHVPEFYE